MSNGLSIHDQHTMLDRQRKADAENLGAMFKHYHDTYQEAEREESLLCETEKLLKHNMKRELAARKKGYATITRLKKAYDREHTRTFRRVS